MATMMRMTAARVARWAGSGRWGKEVHAGGFCRSSCYLRPFSAASRRPAITSLKMPSLSPTMEEGEIVAWRVRPGEAFQAGDVLLEVETDKATMDVEAQEDGVMAKVVVGAKGEGGGGGKIKVGKVIAMLAEQGDDLENVQVPREEEASKESGQVESKATSEDGKSSTSASSPNTASDTSSGSQPATHAMQTSSNGRSISPAVSMLIALKSLSSGEVARIKGTGRHGRLTKGDVLAHLGEIKDPQGQTVLMTRFDAKRTKEERRALRVDATARSDRRGDAAKGQPSEHPPSPGLQLSEAEWRDRIAKSMMTIEARPELAPDVVKLESTRKKRLEREAEDELWDMLLSASYRSKAEALPQRDPFDDVYNDPGWLADGNVEKKNSATTEQTIPHPLPAPAPTTAGRDVDVALLARAAAEGALAALELAQKAPASSLGLTSRPRAPAPPTALHARHFHTTRQRRHGGIEPPRPGEGIHVTFEGSDGTSKSVECNAGDNLLDLAHEHDVDLEGACEGSVACSTCHVILEDWAYNRLEPETDEEADMLDLAFGLTDTSRLGCQIKVTRDLEGMKVKLPSMTRNMYVDGHKPKPH